MYIGPAPEELIFFCLCVRLIIGSAMQQLMDVEAEIGRVQVHVYINMNFEQKTIHIKYNTHNIKYIEYDTYILCFIDAAIHALIAVKAEIGCMQVHLYVLIDMENTHTHTNTHACVCVCVCVCVQLMDVETEMGHMQVHVYICIHTQTCAHTHVCVCVCVHTANGY